MRIGLTTDFSERSRAAFAVAAGLASKFPAELLLIHHARATLLPGVPTLDGFYSSLEDRLAALVASSAELQRAEARPLLVRGGNARTLADAILENGVDLLVTATHGRTGLKRYLLGSFSERLIRVAPCSTLICRSSEEGPRPPGEFDVRRILFATDFSAGSEAAAAAARQWARAFGASVDILHVVDSECGITGFEVEFFEDWHSFHQAKRAEALERLRKIEPEAWSGIETEIRVTIGHPVAEILQSAQEGRTDLVVLGARGASEFLEVPIGSVAERVARKADRPVLLAR